MRLLLESAQARSASGELATDEWLRVLDEVAALGVLQVHFPGGMHVLIAARVSHVRLSLQDSEAPPCHAALTIPDMGFPSVRT